MKLLLEYLFYQFAQHHHERHQLDQQKTWNSTLENVAAAFLQMKEFFPTPEKITFPLQFIIRLIALTNELLKTFLIFLVRLFVNWQLY